MSEYIDREDLLRAIEEQRSVAVQDAKDGKITANIFITCMNVALGIIKSLPAADVRPVKRGVWVPQPSDCENATLLACPECGWMAYFRNGFTLKYCPNCGAEMED